MEKYKNKKDALKNIGLLTEDELRHYGLRKISFDDIPCIEVDDFDEYIRQNGYLTQDEYNNKINNALIKCNSI
ncbi:MAG: hypothetical protein IIX82_04670 [Alistipes sp.]|nr:hypothetical protein [Alistipes sp.]